MTTVGLVGGLGPESTIDYYRRIIDGWKRYEPDSSPSILIDSLDARRALHLVATDVRELTAYLVASLQRLARAGADFIALTANTPHLVFDDLATESAVPLISIVETCAEAAHAMGLRRPALLGTRFTMEASFYPRVFERHEMTLVTPSADARMWVHAYYTEELLNGVFVNETRNRFVSLIARLREESGIDGVILAGTELPLLLKSSEIAGVPVLDTTGLHVDAIVARLRERGRNERETTRRATGVGDV